MTREEAFEIITDLVGPESLKSDRNTDNPNAMESYLHPLMAVFIPMTKPCEYSVSTPHSHPSYSFVYTFDRRSEVIIQGKTVHESGEDNLFWYFPPDMKHQEVMREGINEYIALFIQRDFFEKELKKRNYDRGWTDWKCVPADDSILALINEYIDEMKSGFTDSDQQINALITLLCGKIIRIMTNPAAKPAYLTDKKDMQAVLRYISRHFMDKVTVPQLAAVANRSEAGFIRFFKQQIGSTPVEYLNQFRIDKAKNILRHWNLDITETAFECGFSSSSYFSALFKKETDLTPADYRKKFRKSEF